MLGANPPIIHAAEEPPHPMPPPRVVGNAPAVAPDEFVEPADILARMQRPQPPESAARSRHRIAITDGVVIVGSDAHYWPDYVSTAHRALVHMVHEMRPRLVVLNGDVIDGARISRWAAGDWNEGRDRPMIAEELAVAQERLREIRKAAPEAERVWTFGNHDARFERYILEKAPELEGLRGTRLKDHFPEWIPAWSVHVNEWADSPVVIKHRYRGGVHATWNNVLHSGVTMVTGHLHSLQVRPFSDYRGTRWGVDTGMLGVPHAPQFQNYTEDNPVNWRSGFVVMTFEDGTLLQPELVMVHDEARGIIDFRGRRLKV